MILTDVFLDTQRRVGDLEADQFLMMIFSSGQQSKLYEILAMGDGEIAEDKSNNSVRNFLTAYRQLPDWFSNKEIASGQQVFKKYALDIMTLLGAMSLPYCYAATPGNKALYLTEKMRKVPGKRLLETADFIINVLTPGSLDATGLGHIQINKVRLIHAMVRYHLTKGSWDVTWGTPVNQEDMAGTNLAFSYIILTGLSRTSITLSTAEQESFLHLWRYIGYQLHIVEELLPSNLEDARRLENKIKQRHFKPSPEGRTLTAELIKHYKTYFPALPGYFVDAQMRYLLGREISELLDLHPAFIKDEFIKSVNALKEMMNVFNNNTSSFNKMLANHKKLKEQFL